MEQVVESKGPAVSSCIETPRRAPIGKAAAKAAHRKAGYAPYMGPKLQGPRTVIAHGSQAYPASLLNVRNPPKDLYVIGNVGVLQKEGLAVIGARKATPYGKGCVSRFGGAAAERGIVIVSGGARGCDAQAHRAALDAGGKTIAVLGGGCDQIYPPEHQGLFQRIVDSGGAVISENPWDYPPLPYAFRARNRLIAGLSRAVLIVEAGFPSGTFSTADEALAVSREVLAVPGAITSPTSLGANRLIAQGATPIVDDETFSDALFNVFGLLRQETVAGTGDEPDDPLLAALYANPSTREELMPLAAALCGATPAASWLSQRLSRYEVAGVACRYPDGRYGPIVR